MDPVDRDRLLSEMRRLDIDGDEASLYLATLEVGPCQVRDAAEEAGVHRTSAYRLLEDLADRGLVKISSSQPMELTPTEPKRFFEEIRREKGRELDLVNDIEDEILDALDERYHDNLRTSHGEDRWRILRGRDRIQEETVEALEAAREEVRLLCGEPGGWLSPPGEAEVFSHLPEKAGDLDARALVGTDGDGVDRASKVDVLKPVALRTVDGPLGASSCLVDDEVFAGLVAGETPKCTMAIWSDAPGFYETQRRLFDGLWTTAAGTR